MPFKRLALTGCGLFLLLVVSGARADTRNDLQLWMPVVLEQPIGKARISLEVQTRLDNRLEQINSVRLRPALSYDINDHFAVTAGYFWSPEFLEAFEEESVVYENRLWQQVEAQHRIGKQSRMEYRVRLEQRFLPDTEKTSVRTQYRAQLQVPIKESPWSLIASNEFFWNLNEVPGLPAGFNQNRLYGGLRRQLGKYVAMEGGYILELEDSPGPNAVNHIMLVRVQTTLPRWFDRPKK